MELRLVLRDGIRRRLVLVRASPGTRWSQVSERLSAGDAWYVLPPCGDGRSLPLAADAPLGEPPLLDGALVSTSRSSADRAPVAPVTILVTSGPDCGARAVLTSGGVLTVGRGAVADLVVADPELSRVHLRIRSTRAGVTVQDLGSSNGLLLTGEPVAGEVPWRPGQPLRAGGSLFELCTDAPVPSPLTPDRAGHLVLEPVPVLHERPPPVDIPAAATPGEEPADPPPVVSWSVPLLLSGVIAVVLQMPMVLLFGLMAPAMSLGTYLGERRARRRRAAAATAAYREQSRRAREQALWTAREHLELLRRRVPDPARWSWWVRPRPGGALWSRPDDLLCRVGVSRGPVGVSVAGTPVPLDDVPVELPLTGVVGVTGPAPLVRSFARALLAQLLAGHAPDALGLRLDTDAACRALHWDWLGWAPHCRSTAPAVVVVDALAHGTARPGSSSGAARGASPHMGEACEERVRLVLAASTAELPQPSVAVELAGPGAALLRVGGREWPFRPDLCATGTLAGLARGLAPLRVRSSPLGARPLPADTDFASVAPCKPEVQALVGRWRREPSSTTAVLGVTAGGPAVVDLASDGPHALVGGTTGSGKSELLRTLVASLALVNRPDQLVFLLVDYKGGAAFAEAAALPHTVGLVTDLDAHLAERALASLTAELKRRERVLAAAGAEDLTAYRSDPGNPPLARLVIVIDEFRALTEEVPGFVEGLVDVASLGRSLGVHLVLATQRPGGAVRPDVKTNLNLRICLRMREGSDSYEVLDSAAATTLPEHVRGRALLRTGGAPPRELQVARVSVPLQAGAELTLTELPSPWLDEPTAAAGDGGDGGQTFMAVLARAATAAAAEVGAVPPPSPWLPPLPEVVPVDRLPTAAPGAAQPAVGDGAATACFSVPYGLLDLPREQRQEALRWDASRDGHLAVLGAPRTGRSTLVRTVVAGLVQRCPPEHLHLHVLDLGGALQPLADLPHTVAVADERDVARGHRVVELLAEELARRQRGLATGATGDFVGQRGASAEPWPLHVLVVDGWPRFVEVFGPAATSPTLATVTRILRDGATAGVVALLAGDRTLLTGGLPALLPQLWCLRTTDPTDLLLAGLTRSQVPVRMPQGRAVRVGDGAVAQVAVLGENPSGGAQLAALAHLVEPARRRAATGSEAGLPRRVRALPVELSWEDLPAAGCPGIPLGVGGDDAAPVALPLDPRQGGTALVLGGRRTGRTTALATLAAACAARGYTVVRARLPGEAARLPSLDPAATVVLVDDLGELSGTDLEHVLLSWAHRVRDEGGVMVGAGEPDAVAHAYGGLGRVLARSHVGVVLQPQHPRDGAVWGVQLPTGCRPVAGRGVLVEPGGCTPVQVAMLR